MNGSEILDGDDFKLPIYCARKPHLAEMSMPLNSDIQKHLNQKLSDFAFTSTTWWRRGAHWVATWICGVHSITPHVTLKPRYYLICFLPHSLFPPSLSSFFLFPRMNKNVFIWPRKARTHANTQSFSGYVEGYNSYRFFYAFVTELPFVRGFMGTHLVLRASEAWRQCMISCYMIRLHMYTYHILLYEGMEDCRATYTNAFGSQKVKLRCNCCALSLLISYCVVKSSEKET